MKFLRSIFTLFLLCTFLSSISGLQVYKHYCGDFLESVSFYVQTDLCSDEGGEEACSAESESDCCEDEFEFHRLNVDLIKNSDQKEQLKFQNSFIFLYTLISTNVEDDELRPEFVRLKAPPKVPIYKINSSYIFYG